MILQNICKSYNGKPVLRGVTLTVTPGITCLMGLSGSGKTTLLRILLGLEKPDTGKLIDMPERFAVVFQEDRLVETLTVRANLRAALSKTWDEKKAEACLNKLGLPGVLSETVSSLSGGMKRRVALARALLYDAPLLVLDEPFKGLDPETRALAIARVREQASMRPVLAVIHDEEECTLLNGRIVHLNDLQED
jgi:NitT/TauT family transport system ATP-binding protein